MFNKFCRWLDSNRGPLVLEATAQPTEPQPLPFLYLQEGLEDCKSILEKRASANAGANNETDGPLDDQTELGQV